MCTTLLSNKSDMPRATTLRQLLDYYYTVDKTVASDWFWLHDVKPNRWCMLHVSCSVFVCTCHSLSDVTWIVEGIVSPQQTATNTAPNLLQTYLVYHIEQICYQFASIIQFLLKMLIIPSHLFLSWLALLPKQDALKVEYLAHMIRVWSNVG